MIIIGLTGKAGSGKTTIVARYLEDNFGFRCLSFGDAIKSLCIRHGLLTEEECYTRKTRHSRKMMQKIGDIVRDVYSEYPIEIMDEQLEEADIDGINVVIDDIRLLEEVAYLRSTRYPLTIVKVVCTDRQASHADTHRTETEVDQIETDHTITARFGDSETLEFGIKEIAESLLEEHHEATVGDDEIRC